MVSHELPSKGVVTLGECVKEQGLGAPKRFYLCCGALVSVCVL